ncbi:SRPBCC family protein [Jannaschia sp. KMU-145]|uniref:SRPBCC family protein n=1 Tax=Jannaschia halovivens TaxID=3388667 RepID=UPI00396AFF7A
MKFVAVEDIAAPIEHVWARVSDLDRFEARIASRVGRMTRSPDGEPRPGTAWSARAEVAGKKRDVTVTLNQLDGPQRIDLSAATDGMDVGIDVALEAMSPTRTRLTVTTEAKARSLAARLMLQSAKLARQTLAKRYKGRVAEFAQAIETGYGAG